jgi:hypothetical protein
MTDGADTQGMLRQNQEVRVVPRSEVPDGTGLVVQVRVLLDNSYRPAQQAFARFVQNYAERLARETSYQEISERPSGATTAEITESAVVRAQESLERKIAQERRPADARDAFALAGVPIFSGAAGVAGSYLHSRPQWIAFLALAIVAASCVLYLLKRRLL